MLKSLRVAHFLAWDAVQSLPLLFLILGSFLGLLFTFLVAPLQVPDETAHFYRSYGVSTGACVASPDQALPASLQQFQTDFSSPVEDGPIQFRDFLQSMQTRMDGQVNITNLAANTYSCAPYLVSAAGVAVAKLLSSPALVLLYSARLANLAFYLALVYTALRIVPVGRLGLFCLALMPMTLQQAASVSADSPTIASAFLFLAYVAYLSFDPRLKTVSTGQLVLAGALLLFTCLCKFNLWFSPLVLLIPAERIGTLRKKLIAASVMFAVLLLVAALWQIVNQANLAVFAGSKAAAQIYVGANMNFVLHRPLEFASVLFRTWRFNAGKYAAEFVGTLGWLEIDLPFWTVWSYLGLLLVAASVETKMRLTAAQRAVCAAVVCASFISIFVILWTMETKRPFFMEEILGTHRGLIPGVQGRYFIPFAPVVILMISNGMLRAKANLAVACCVAMIVVTGGISLVRIYGEYYAP